MKILTLNIRNGCTKHHSAMVSWLLQQRSADILVITEFRDNVPGRKLRQALQNAGWTYTASSNPAHKINGVLVASRICFTPVPQPEIIPEGSARFIECDFETFALIGVYFPLKKALLNFWSWFLPQAASRAKSPCLLVGDFNTGKHFIDEDKATFWGSENMVHIEELGYRDAWRTLHPLDREYTWFYTVGIGFRLDYVFLSATLIERLTSADHLHTPRELCISDHSALQVTLT